MQNFYFGKLDNSFIVYIDPFNIDLFNFSKHFSSVYCNEIIFDNCAENSLINTKFSITSFIEKIKNKIITEIDIVFDYKIHIQNVWWDDLLVIANLDKLSLVLDLLKQTMSVRELSKLDICIESPNYYFSFDSIISKQEVTPNLFKDFIKDSDHYFDKEQKFI
jgi:hypothetical protein